MPTPTQEHACLHTGTHRVLTYTHVGTYPYTHTLTKAPRHGLMETGRGQCRGLHLRSCHGNLPVLPGLGPGFGPGEHSSPRLLLPLREDLSRPDGSARSHRLLPSQQEASAKRHPVLKMMLDLPEATALPNLSFSGPVERRPLSP